MSDPGSATAPIMGQAPPVELMNTVWADRSGVHDSLTAIADARRWLRALRSHHEAPASGGAPTAEGASRHGVLASGDALSVDGLPRLRGLRDAVRRVAAGRTGDPRERAVSAAIGLAAAVRTVNAAARAARIRPVLELAADGAVVGGTQARGTPDDVLVAGFARDAIDFFGAADPPDLRACLAPGCVLYFVKDHPRREWCSAACGNRARAARHYARHGAGAPGRTVT